jgi:hypothetical protein
MNDEKKNGLMPKKLEPLAKRALVYGVMASLFAFVFPVIWVLAMITLPHLHEIMGSMFAIPLPISFLLSMAFALSALHLGGNALAKIRHSQGAATGEKQALTAMTLALSVGLAGLLLAFILLH